MSLYITAHFNDFASGVADWEVAFFSELALFNYFAFNLRQNLLFGVASLEVAFFGELAFRN